MKLERYSIENLNPDWTNKESYELVHYKQSLHIYSIYMHTLRVSIQVDSRNMSRMG